MSIPSSSDLADGPRRIPYRIPFDRRSVSSASVREPDRHRSMSSDTWHLKRAHQHNYHELHRRLSARSNLGVRLGHLCFTCHRTHLLNSVDGGALGLVTKETDLYLVYLFMHSLRDHPEVQTSERAPGVWNRRMRIGFRRPKTLRLRSDDTIRETESRQLSLSHSRAHRARDLLSSVCVSVRLYV